MDDPGHRWHDMGGRPAGRCERDEHEYQTWEKRVDALMVLLSYKCKAMTVDELRRYIEELGPGVYDDLGYYERWMHSLTQAMLQRGMITVDELAAKMGELEARGHD